MITLKKLLAREWIMAFLASLFILVLLVAVANIVSELLRAVTTFKDILTNFFLDVPRWLGQVFPLATMMATLFSLNKLQRRSELMAMLSLGFSRTHFVVVISLLATVVACIQFWVAAYVRPQAQMLKKSWLREGGAFFRQSNPQSVIDSTAGGGKIWYRNQNYFHSFTAFDKERQQLRKVSLYYYDGSGHISEMVRADAATFKDQKDWLFSDGEWITDLNTINKFPTVTPFKELVKTIDEVPASFKRIDDNINELSFIPLYQYINRIKILGIKAAEYEVMLYDKIVMGIICILFSLVSVSALFNPHRRHSSFGKNILFVLVFTAFFWPGYSFFQVLGSDGYMPPLLASFMVPLLCSLYLMFYFYRHRRVSG